MSRSPLERSVEGAASGSSQREGGRWNAPPRHADGTQLSPLTTVTTHSIPKGAGVAWGPRLVPPSLHYNPRNRTA